MKQLWTGALLALAMAFARPAFAQQDTAPATTPAAATAPTQASVEPAAAQATGTLVVDVKPFSSEKELPKRIEKQLRSGGIEWGIKDGRIVITMVNKRFIDFDIAHMTRYGQAETLALPAGDYRVTAIGLEMHTAFSPEKVLAKGAYVNEDVVAFHVEPGKTTTLSILPTMKKDMTFMIDWYMPALMTSVVTDGIATDAKAINVRRDGSIAWPDYTGPLKFTAR